MNTRALPFWRYDNSSMEIIFDPWSSQEHAIVNHGSKQFEWARNIHNAIVEGYANEPALFPDWEGKTIFLVGRGQSQPDGALLAERRPGPVIFLNHAADCDFRHPGDYMMCLDSAVEDAFKGDQSGLTLITFPGINTSMIKKRWDAVKWFTFWPKAPLLDWMREAFPELPVYTECLCVATTALHLAAMHKPRRIVCIGWDFEGGGEDYKKLAMASNAMARFVSERGIEIINTSSGGLFGVLNNGDRVAWIKRKTLERVLEEEEQ